MVLVNEHDQVLGHTYRISAEDEDVHDFWELEFTDVDIPSELREHTVPPLSRTQVGERTVFFVPVANTAWRLYSVSRR